MLIDLFNAINILWLGKMCLRSRVLTAHTSTHTHAHKFSTFNQRIDKSINLFRWNRTWYNWMFVRWSKTNAEQTHKSTAPKCTDSKHSVLHMRLYTYPQINHFSCLGSFIQATDHRQLAGRQAQRTGWKPSILVILAWKANALFLRAA